jgi:isoamyl acetate esterase
VPISRYQENLTYMVELIRARNIKVIVVGPALHETTEEDDPRSSNLNRKYSQAAEQICQRLNIPFVNLWNAFARDVGFDINSSAIPPGDKGSEITDLSKLLCDGIHFHGRGYQLWYNELKQCIKENYPELDSDNIPHLFPPHEMVDINDIEKSIVNWDSGYEFKD